MGARYYRELRAKYASTSNPLKGLSCTDNSHAGKEVFSAMLQAKRVPCNVAPFILGIAANNAGA